jgi:hypothetical protein
MSSAHAAFAGGTNASFTTLHAASVSGSYTGAEESGTFDFSLPFSTSYVQYQNPVGSYGLSVLLVGGVSTGVDGFGGALLFNTGVFNLQSVSATFIWEIEFSSLDGAVRMLESQVDSGSTLSAVNAFGQSVALGEGALLANGRYLFTYTTNVVSTPGFGFNNAGGTFLFESATIPAPGAIALLGLAGLAGRRRR